jgi:hypothetical protein
MNSIHDLKKYARYNLDFCSSVWWNGECVCTRPKQPFTHKAYLIPAMMGGVITTSEPDTFSFPWSDKDIVVFSNPEGPPTWVHGKLLGQHSYTRLL